MDTFNDQDLKQLLDMSSKWCVSFYMPAHRVGREQQQDPIRFKNLIAQVEEKLLEYGADRTEVREMMRPMERLVSDADFWQHQSDGLAVFLSSGFSKTYRLPSKFEELMVISKNFHIKPLLPLINENGQFYILAVSLNNIRLFFGNRDLVNEVKLSTVPTSMDDALHHMEDPEKQLGYHTGTRNPSARGAQPAIFHGQGNDADDDEKDILRYFQLVDAGLKSILNDESIPMVLAGVDYLLPIYHDANSYAGLLKDGLTGNPDEMDEKELHKHAWKLVEPVFDKNKQKAMKQFGLLDGKNSDLATDELKTIVKAAKYGQVDTLFVPLNTQRWGRFEQKTGKMFLADEFSTDNEDLLNFAATQTILNSGQVFALDDDEVPGSGEQAAILRY
ncbi:MAG TPA: hypothetical protein VJ972_12025 [Anaerolineales bacterium]|nr:hypothetical protein [Anaerolineales bacterium]